jgi:exopolyphosphatase/guanosine-5'-triphosphate,3'-diphosphate pyrophosphatase
VGLAGSRLERQDGQLLLRIAPAHQALVGDAVLRRLRLLGQTLGLEARVVVGD